MSQDQRNLGYGEQEDDSISVRELVQTLTRNLRLIVLVTGLVGALTLLWVATRTPVYEARATLLLEVDEAAGGVLSQLASLSQDPAAEAEIALIKSRSLAVVTVAEGEAFDFSGGLFDATEPDFDPIAATQIPDDEGADFIEPQMDSLGLSTIVEAYDRRPGASILRRLSGEGTARHRLRARMRPVALGAGQAARPTSLAVYFPTSGRVRIAAHERFLFAPEIEPGVEGAVETDFQPGLPFEALGYELRLAPFGDYAGQQYRLSRISRQDAIDWLMLNTAATEAGRQTNVVNVSVRDTSPYRAAEIANSLAKNYIRRSVQIGRQKATRTVVFIQRQLEQKLNDLRRAEKAMTDLQSANPETISVIDSAKGIIEVLTTLEINRTQLQLIQTQLQEAVSLMEAGNYSALGRIGKESHSLVAFGYIQELTVLQAELLRLDRTDIRGYKQLLQSEVLRLESIIEETKITVTSYQEGLASIKAGDTSALVRILAQPASSKVKSGFEPYLATLAAFDDDIARKGTTQLPSNPELKELIRGREQFIVHLSDQVGGTLKGIQATLVGYESLRSDYAASLKEWPESERATINGALKSLHNRILANMNSQLTSFGEQVEAMDGKIQEQNLRLGQLPQGQLALAQSTRDRETYAGIVAFLLEKEQEAKINAAATSAAAVLIDPAVPPVGRQFPNTLTFVALGLIVGSMLGAGLALLRNALQAALHTEAEVERASGLPVIGAIPDYLRGRTKIKAARRGERFLPMRDAPHGPQAEAYRAIRATLKQAMRGDDALRTLATTSCMMGEGKTVTNCDLAIVFTKAGRRVLLVDCDLRRPQVHKLFGAARGPGFAEVLEDEADWRDCVADSGMEGLSVLPAGRTKANAGELLVGNRAVQIIEELKEEYDLVVFDVPPAVVVADVASFASNLDAILLVYRSGMAPGRLLTRTVNMLQQAEVNVLGVIVNAIVMGRMSASYGYGYEDDYTSLPDDDDEEA